jgi:hypothetical protein
MHGDDKFRRTCVLSACQNHVAGEGGRWARCQKQLKVSCILEFRLKEKIDSSRPGPCGANR